MRQGGRISQSQFRSLRIPTALALASRILRNSGRYRLDIAFHLASAIDQKLAERWVLGGEPAVPQQTEPQSLLFLELNRVAV